LCFPEICSFVELLLLPLYPNNQYAQISHWTCVLCYCVTDRTMFLPFNFCWCKKKQLNIYMFSVWVIIHLFISYMTATIKTQIQGRLSIIIGPGQSSALAPTDRTMFLPFNFCWCKKKQLNIYIHAMTIFFPGTNCHDRKTTTQ
jgi:hypothetical protein